MEGNFDYNLFGEKILRDELLRDKFGIIPFSVLDSKTAEWKKRKSLWLSKGIKSELGRKDDLMKFKRVYSKGNPRLFSDRATSIFCPVLTELMYRWFCTDGGKIIDPFAGGSVRGVVANYLGYTYCGIELRDEQVKNNQEQAREIFTHQMPNWLVGDSDVVLENLPDNGFDMVFTCPPYFNLEVYSDDPSDLSNMTFDNYIAKFKSILHKSISKLKDNRFFVIVIGDVRDDDRKVNWYRNLIGITKSIILERPEIHLYNDLILLENIGTSAMRVEQAFSKRKMVKVHQNILVFYKGNDVNDIRDTFSK